MATTRAEDRPGAMPLALLVAGVEVGNGVLMLLAPAQFAGPAYAAVFPRLAPYGLLLIVGGLAVAAATTRPSLRIAALASLLLLPLWWSFLSAGLVSGVITLGMQTAVGVGTALAWPRLADPRAPAVVFGAIQILIAAAIALVPGQFRVASLYGWYGDHLWLFAPSFAIAGLGLALARGATVGRVFGLLAALNFGVLAAAFVDTRVWTGVLNYGLMTWILLMSRVVAGTRAGAATLLFTGAALIALVDALPWLAQEIAEDAPRPDGASMRPSTIVGVAILAVAGALASRAARARTTVLAAIVAAEALLVVGLSRTAPVGPDGSVGAATDFFPTTTSVVLLGFAALAVGSLGLGRDRARWIGLIAATLVSATAALTLLAHVARQEVLFSALGVVSIRLHTAITLLFLGLGVVALTLPRVVQRSVNERLAAGFGAVLTLVSIQLFVSVSTIGRLPGLVARDPALAGEVSAAAASMLLGLFAATGAAMVAVGYATTRSLTDPLGELVGAMRRFGAGERGVRSLIARRDEIGVSAAQFNEMAAELDRSRARLELDALHDAVTSLPNRRLLMDHLTVAIADARREGTSCACVMVDLDRFKEVNDRSGHAAGDAVLRAVADRLRAEVRPADTVARIGGDEFAVVLPRTVPADVPPTMRRLELAVGAPIPIDGGVASVGASLGMGIFPEDGETPEALLAAADAAMYGVKRTRHS